MILKNWHIYVAQLEVNIYRNDSDHSAPMGKVALSNIPGTLKKNGVWSISKFSKRLKKEFE